VSKIQEYDMEIRPTKLVKDKDWPRSLQKEMKRI
jgi:hypothetical protein